MLITLVWFLLINNSESYNDDNVHGTHVAGVIGVDCQAKLVLPHTWRLMVINRLIKHLFC